MVPHFCEELWQVSGHRQPLHTAFWPQYNLEAAREEEITIVVQINGKVRAKLQVPADIEDQALQQAAVNDEKIASLLENKVPRKIIVVPKKLVNIVL
jgi:leucyl-tRNA synthetase